MAQFLAMDQKVAGSIQQVVCRLHRFSAASSPWRTALALPPFGAPFRRASGRILIVADLGDFGFKAPGGSFEARNDAVKLSNKLCPVTSNQTQQIPLVLQ